MAPARLLSPRCRRLVLQSILILTLTMCCHRSLAVVDGALVADVQFAGLEALFIATNGQEWTRSSGWRNTTLSVCDWYGVTCDDGSGNVTALSLSNNGLEGNLSSTTMELTYITSLKEVDLSSNRLFGPVPLRFGLMPMLEKLDLSGNELSSFPAAWGSGALALRHLSVQDNKISGSLPSMWLSVNQSGAYPLIHWQSVSPWMPELRSLLVGGNSLDSTGYAALQAVVTLKSLQVCGFSGNALTGSVKDALTLYYCDGSGSMGCSAYAAGVAAPSLRVLKLDGNSLAGQLPSEVSSETRKIDVLDVSDNTDISGLVPDSYSALQMLYADGTAFSGSQLPAFVDTASGSRYEFKHIMLVCGSIEPSPDEEIVAVALDPSYDDFSLCTCSDGFEDSHGSCTKCSYGWYRSVDEDGHTSDDCVACPTSSTTLQKGSLLKSQCVCSVNFYDELGGRGPGPSCVQCPVGSRTLTAGAISVTACECAPGYVFDVAASECKACTAGTYKPAYGNQPELCLSCPTGTFSDTIRATSSSSCLACPLGFYGNSYGASSVNDCTECPAGTYGAAEGLPSESLCTACWAGFYSPTLGANSSSTCIGCPRNHSQPITGAGSRLDCIPCSAGQIAGKGFSQCTVEVSQDSTLIGLYLLIAGVFLVVLTLVWVFLQKYYGVEVPVKEKVHMTLNEEMKGFIYGQQFWISLFSVVEILDLMSDLGAYASLLYTAALTGAMKIVYTVVVAFALTASLHGVHTRAIIILDMHEERTHGLAITGNDMLYYEKQFNILQIMTQKRTCRRHVPFDRGNKYLSHHIGVQRLISLNSMRIIIAIFEDIPVLVLNMSLLLQQPNLATNKLFMISFVMSIFVLGYKMTLLEKHARLQIRKWNLEARMDSDTMLNKKAARGRRFSWACEQCEAEGISPEEQKDATESLLVAQTAIKATKHGSGNGNSDSIAVTRMRKSKGAKPANDKNGGSTPNVPEKQEDGRGNAAANYSKPSNERNSDEQTKAVTTDGRLSNVERSIPPRTSTAAWRY